MKKTMNTKKITYWVLTGLVSFVFIGSSIGKLTANPEAVKMGAEFGINSSAYFTLGLIELLSVLLFIIPRTGIVGTLLLAAYMGGAIATHLEHGQSVIAPCVIQAVLWMVAVYRFPELRTRILSKQD
jgi:hypothetical protein